MLIQLSGARLARTTHGYEDKATGLLTVSGRPVCVAAGAEP